MRTSYGISGPSGTRSLTEEGVMAMLRAGRIKYGYETTYVNRHPFPDLMLRHEENSRLHEVHGVEVKYRTQWRPSGDDNKLMNQFVPLYGVTCAFWAVDFRGLRIRIYVSHHGEFASEIALDQYLEEYFTFGLTPRGFRQLLRVGAEEFKRLYKLHRAKSSTIILPDRTRA